MFTPRRRSRPELLDLPFEAQDEGQLRGCLMDIRQVNLLLGGVSSALKELDFVLKRRLLHPPLKIRGGPRGRYENLDSRRSLPRYDESLRGNDGLSSTVLKILDVAAGAADVTAAMARFAGKRGFRAWAVAADLNFGVLVHAREWNRDSTGITYVMADGLNLPFPDGSFDVVHCSLVLHHLGEEDAVNFLKEMARVSRFAVIAGDLRRNRIPWSLIWIITRIFTSNKYTRYDGPLSVLKAFTPREMKRLAEASGLKEFRIRRRRFWRMSLTGFV